MRKILITGGLGFIGFHLIDYLLKKYEGLNITVVDNLSSSKINFGPEYAKLNVIIKDLLETEGLDDDYSDIYHLASPVGSLGILGKNGFVARNIIDLTYKVLDIAYQCNSKLLYVSSSEIYGHSGVHDEDDAKYISGATGTRTEYSLGKITSEVILKNINLNRTINYNIVRPFNVVGEQQSSQIGFVFPTFFENALRNENIPVFYNGLQKRSFCHVEDIVKAIVSIQESNISHDVFNIGHNGNTTTIMDLAKRIKKICNSKSGIISVDPVEKYGKCYIEACDKIPNINKISRRLGWKPEIDLESALERVYVYHKKTGQ
jgi:nucleoside-diphosphate-sugar epimerase